MKFDSSSDLKLKHNVSPETMFLEIMLNFEKMTPLITSLQKKSKKNNQENMNRRHKILNFVRRFKKAIHENFFF